ncbi:hypothetical protein ACFVGN_34290 [Streptomyces sp. NPDC057757]|uniref:hypothetical protein n=1 Tax=Streptomyces sp. NPDC057757 TaxID=3346241 RepID=UPI0036BA383D
MPGFLLRHEVTVEPYEGDGAAGQLFGSPVVVRCFLEQKNRRVRDRQGRQVVSSSTFYCRLLDPDGNPVVAPPESKVTLPDGRETTVIDEVPHDGGGLPTYDHLEVQLA